MSEPNLAYWDDEDLFTLREAAVLWCNKDPFSEKPPYNDPAISQKLDLLYDAIKSGKIEVYRSQGTGSKWLVKTEKVKHDKKELRRDILLAFAEKINDIPIFLMPLDKRGNNKSNEQAQPEAAEKSRLHSTEKIEDDNEYLIYERQSLTLWDAAHICAGYRPSSRNRIIEGNYFGLLEKVNRGIINPTGIDTGISEVEPLKPEVEAYLNIFRDVATQNQQASQGDIPKDFRERCADEAGIEYGLRYYKFSNSELKQFQNIPPNKFFNPELREKQVEGQPDEQAQSSAREPREGDPWKAEAIKIIRNIIQPEVNGGRKISNDTIINHFDIEEFLENDKVKFGERVIKELIPIARKSEGISRKTGPKTP